MSNNKKNSSKKKMNYKGNKNYNKKNNYKNNNQHNNNKKKQGQPLKRENIKVNDNSLQLKESSIVNEVPETKSIINNVKLDVTMDRKKKIVSKDSVKKIINNFKHDNFVKDIVNLTKKDRLKKYLKESLLFATIMTIFDIIGYFIFDEIILLKLFNLVYLNAIISVVISFIILFIISYLFDYAVSEISLKIYNKKSNK